MPTIYETDADIPSFAGINTGTDGYNMSMRYAINEYNVNTEGGGFTQMRKGTPVPLGLPTGIDTIAVLHRRFDAEAPDLLVAISGGRVYTKKLDGDDMWVIRYDGLHESECSYVTYEVTREGEDDPVDVLIFTNSYDGMFIMYGDTLAVEAVSTPYKFGIICRSNERIWGTAIHGKPDTLVYSAPYNPMDWASNEDIPEDGGGEIQQPSWDGDSFIALRSYGTALLAFKKNSVWRVSGTNPGSYVMREQFGGGTVEADTIVVNQSLVYMMGFDGILRYDGNGSYPFQWQALSGLLQRRLNFSARNRMCATMRQQKYLLAFPMDDSDYCNAVLEYNPTDQTFLLRTGIDVSKFLTYMGRVWYVSAKAPGILYEMDEQGECLPIKWVSAYQDLGIKGSVKSAFTAYFTCEADGRFPLTVGIRTEKKVKKKNLVITPGKPVKTNINVSGRYFRVEIESDSRIPFRINGGMRFHMELDPD